MEKAVFMMDYLNISQKANDSFSHQGDKAIDLAGKDIGIDSFKAPFTGVIKRIYTNVNAVWLESIDKVKYADGTVDYMTILTMHDDDISNLKVGKIIKQGDIYYDEGRKGYTTGNHIHLAIGKGKFLGSGWYQNQYGNYVINNQYDVYKALYLFNGVKIINDGGYNFIRTDLLKESEKQNTYVVKSGETLYGIARKFNTTVSELARINNIVNVNLIYPGQIILLNGDNIYFNRYLGNSNSIVDALKSIREKSDYEYRVKVAKLNGIINYMGTVVQNMKLLELLKQGKLIKL